MYIQKASLRGFRNLQNLDIELKNGLNLFYGSNAQGKTNFLESLYLCATGRSQRTRNDAQMVRFHEQESHIRIFVQKENFTDRIDVHLRRDEKKGIAVNGLPIKKLGELFGTLQVVIFSPEDLNLIKGGPSERRRFIDMELCQLSRIYYYDLQQYHRILRQRNNLLKEIQKKPSLKDTLFPWDEQLFEFGRRIIIARRNFLRKLNVISSEKQLSLTGGTENLEITYKPNCSEDLFYEKLEKNRHRDIVFGATQSGPHKDDIGFFIHGNDVKIYGSQGQQRVTALAARLAEIDLIQEETGQKPVLLLDDVLSELDEHRQNFLLESISGIQSILTCTGIEDSIKKYMKEDSIFYVEEGQIHKR